ncbi:hypothetical protein GV67_07370 [Pseudorhizobium pelagicum]|uniref:Uncharacterized protein n=1 Tax=Pseudorhizobium pelagicum TaxID=1509405 RepID=A0A922T9N3_9HYPH|nr:hypothetical protein GV68_17680 [Pseudorhizobium pelagicum]KEQ04909.1 hypothetical protein GV67_07370 [Pseudorhizobium pelagicum]
MSTTNHIGIADELIDPTRAKGQMAKMMPLAGVRVIVLHESEGAPPKRHDPHVNAWCSEIVRLYWIGRFAFRVDPPLANCGRFKPAVDHRKVRNLHFFKVIHFQG